MSDNPNLSATPDDELPWTPADGEAWRAEQATVNGPYRFLYEMPGAEFTRELMGLEPGQMPRYLSVTIDAERLTPAGRLALTDWLQISDAASDADLMRVDERDVYLATYGYDPGLQMVVSQPLEAAGELSEADVSRSLETMVQTWDQAKEDDLWDEVRLDLDDALEEERMTALEADERLAPSRMSRIEWDLTEADAAARYGAEVNAEINRTRGLGDW